MTWTRHCLVFEIESHVSWAGLELTVIEDDLRLSAGITGMYHCSV